MKVHIKNFLMRGLMASVGGPVIMAIVYKALSSSGIVSTMSADEVFIGITTSAVLAFIAGGISVVYNIEKLPLICATFIHAVTLFADYIIIYLINGWISTNQILLFIGIFFGVYAVVWAIVYALIRLSVKQANSRLNA